MNRQAILGKAIKGEERIYGFQILAHYLGEVVAVGIIAESAITTNMRITGSSEEGGRGISFTK
ncbi:uncharacterized protein RCO7_14679 [Rhynchosporium graminicola]|uniref:Uncharacterized protein n=1 Tax=Rhynchosporium graminicola TaxID=2792576 RepID=A0A1E1KVN5_9HELO|nr:uncharacterized protein RCO7_14679 [Rhynchosporium commune]